MKYLLDTHALLWYFEDSPKLPGTVSAIIENTQTQKYISIASMWEFTIKQSLGKLYFDGGVDAFWSMTEENGFFVLPITKSYLIEAAKLPFLHRDPFDRLLVATAIVESIAILSSDDNIHKYNVKCVW